MLNKIAELDRKIVKYVDKKVCNQKNDKVMKVITFIGDYALMSVAIILMLMLFGYKIISMTMAYSLTVTVTVNELMLKNLFKRIRPANRLQFDNIIIKVPTSYSFPSGHTATSFAVVPLSMIFDFYLGILTLLMAIAVGFSRIYMKVHYPSDVLAGATVGCIMSIITYIVIFIK